MPVPGGSAAGQDQQHEQETMSTSSTAAGRYAGQPQLDAAVAALWQAVRTEHPELPELPPVLNARYPKEAMPTTAAAVATSVLREAVHELAEVRDVTVVSRGGRYHNKLFAQLAAELGLRAEGDSTTAGGWATLTLLPETAERYADQLGDLDRVLTTYPVPAAPDPAVRKKTDDGGRKVTAACRCTPAHRVWMSRTLLEQQVVMCGRCAREGRDPLFVDVATLRV